MTQDNRNRDKALSDKIKQVAVIGAGTMGNGICHVFAQNGFKVNMVDISQTSLDTALAKIAKNMDRQIAKNIFDEEAKKTALGNISTFTDLKEAVQDADLVVEAATENTNIKLKIFADLDRHCPEKTILASNTSSISITKIAAQVQRPGKVIGMHFMNPVPVMKLVEVINGYSTEREVTELILSLSRALNKVPCVVNDYPGFIANRVLMPMINEAIIALQEGVAGVEEIDTVMKLGMAYPMGPLQLADFIGLDTCLSILRVLHEGFGKQKYAPASLLINMVQAGFLGAKSGEGFYKYTPGTKEKIVSSRFVNKSW